MATMGRKLLPSDNPGSASERFAWIVRALRASSPVADIRKTETFAQKLNSHLVEHLQPATINRLETGTLDFTIERCVAYESALGLPDGQLVDVYLWLFRHRGLVPKTAWATLHEASSSEIELLVRLAQDEPLRPLDWLHLAYLYRNRPELIKGSKRLNDLFIGGMVRDMGRYYERDQRIVREALIIVGDDIVPAVLAAVEEEPIRFFNATEALGFIPGAQAWNALAKLHDEMQDVFAAPGILDSLIRKSNLDSQAKYRDPHVSNRLKEYCLSILDQTETLFIARESSLATVQYIRDNLSTKEQRRLEQLRPDLRQLAVNPITASRREIVEDVMRRHSTAVERSRQLDDIPLIMPGLSRILHDGLFAADRVERITNSVLLTPWQETSALTEAVGGSAYKISAIDYGTQRSMVRFATKLGSPNLNHYLRRIASSGEIDTNTSVSIAWALGAGTDKADEATLDQMYANTRSSEVRRAVCTAAMRRGQTSLLTKISRDKDGVVAREAMLGLSMVASRAKG
jgi:hypothetical protein